MQTQPKGSSVFGIDLGKNTFHIFCVDSAGNPIERVNIDARHCLGSLQ